MARGGRGKKSGSTLGGIIGVLVVFAIIYNGAILVIAGAVAVIWLIVHIVKSARTRRNNLLFSPNAELYAADFMEGHDFEYWCADLLRYNDFKHVTVTKSSGDQGVDITAQLNQRKYAIQCKRVSSKLGNTPVQEVYTGKNLYGCSYTAVMTNNYFTKGAFEAAAATNTLLWDRDSLYKMLLHKQSVILKQSRNMPIVSETQKAKEKPMLVNSSSDGNKYCPSCGAVLQANWKFCNVCGRRLQNHLPVGTANMSNTGPLVRRSLWDANALKAAQEYLKEDIYSYSELVHQLEFDEYTPEQAKYAADNCGANWFEQAYRAAKEYLSEEACSRQALVEHLAYLEFTPEQVAYAVQRLES